MLIERARPPAVKKPRIPANPSCVNVLVIDDDDADRSLAIDALEQIDGISSITTLACATEAFDALSSGKLNPDLILLDLQMPRKDGIAFLDDLAANKLLRNLPVVMLTTSKMKADIERCRTRNACAYIVKPDGPRDWRERLEAVVWRTMLGKWN